MRKQTGCPDLWIQNSLFIYLHFYKFTFLCIRRSILLNRKTVPAHRMSVLRQSWSSRLPERRCRIVSWKYQGTQPCVQGSQMDIRRRQHVRYGRELHRAVAFLLWHEILPYILRYRFWCLRRRRLKVKCRQYQTQASLRFWRASATVALETGSSMILSSIPNGFR